MNIETSEKPTPVKTRKSKIVENEKIESVQFNIRVPSEIATAIDLLMQNATSTMQKTIDKASFGKDGKPHDGDRTRFLAYAIMVGLKAINPEESPQRFGKKIDADVEEIMKRNIVAHDTGEWWNVTCISRSLLVEQGHNPLSVKRWLEENSERVEEHHKSVECFAKGTKNVDIQDYNRRAAKYRKALNVE